MNIAADACNTADAFRCAWVLLDEASQVLLRAEAIVVLLGGESESSAHHAYAADVASDLLRTLKEKLSEAQKLLQPVRPANPGI